ncbi:MULTISPECIES: P-type conjugative transfer protein TrbJ [Brevundimonas]|nr:MULTISPECIES: P-type conjugative transfer protein TrbJ [Brevundimonas]
MRRNHLLAAVAAVSLTLTGVGSAPSAAVAQAVYCTNCASQVTQLKQQADQALSLLRQAEQLSTQLKQYEQALQDGLALPDQMFGDVARDLASINNLMDQAQGLAYTASNLDQAFADRYGSFESYRQNGVSDEQLQAKYRQWSDESNSSILTAMRALGLQSQGMDSEAAMLRQLQSRAGSARGQMQAIQVGNELAAESVAQMQRLRQLLMTQTQLQAQQMQLEADRNAVGDARARQFFSRGESTYSGSTY